MLSNLHNPSSQPPHFVVGNPSPPCTDKSNDLPPEDDQMELLTLKTMLLARNTSSISIDSCLPFFGIKYYNE
ncbi:hypothetical protein D8674_026404 [Pyrus ussuriensis x Pyrus communis]|uniref:Uncharacterized protein n=1 Tax=Pyrus ussuriensis x Pyrus communis TaxID=2448454 RepID=A0A5N5IDS6_9ROSA|nr:hypothetical protein D8674_026404 [Pyrus ussuriensis x Pyrus communis]